METAPTRPAADLHTHLTGAPRGADLVRLGLQHGLPYPAAMLRLAGVPLPPGVPLRASDTVALPGGISAAAEGSPSVMLRDLPAESLSRLAAAMAMPALAPGEDGFPALERAYSVRRPLGACPALLGGILAAVAADAAADGVGHVELSASAACGGAWMEAASAAAASARRATGVRVLFLATVNRHASPASLARSMDAAAEAMGSFPLLVGLDVAGHETNPSSDFMPSVTAWAAAMARRGRAASVRVHACETPFHPGNVRAALEGFLDAGMAPGMGRVGHALHGVGRREVALAREAGAVFEMGLASNRALGYRSGPGRGGGGGRLARLLRAGAAAVLGTDGGGIYGTSRSGEARIALGDGAPAWALAEVARHEADHVGRMAAAFPGAA